MDVDKSLSLIFTVAILGMILIWLNNICGFRVGIDWQGLAIKVENSKMKSSDEILSIIHDIPEWIVKDGTVVDGRKLRLKLLHNNRPWQEMEREIFPDLRVSRIRVVYTYRKDNTDRPISIQDKLIPVSNLLTEPPEIVRMGTYTTGNDHRGLRLALQTNLAYDLLAIPSLGLEISLPHSWSVGIDGYYAWWSNASKAKYWRVQGGEISVRKYFGNNILTGHHIGIYSQLLRYDICFGKRGYLSGGSGTLFTDHPSWGVGAEYGYSIMIATCLRLDLSIGLGWFTGQYAVYQPIDSHNVFRSMHQRNWFGPTRIGITLSWLIEKGGDR